MSPSPGFSSASIFILLWRAEGSVAYDSACAILESGTGLFWVWGQYVELTAFVF